MAQNTEDTVHIPVPNYDKLRSKEYLSDKELKNVSGGEVVVAAIVAAIGVGLSGVVLAGIVLASTLIKKK